MKNNHGHRVHAIFRSGVRCVAGAVSAFLLILPAQGQGQGFFRTEGTQILNREGNPVVLRGLGLGGWLVPEGYMLHMTAIDGGSPRTIRAQIADLIGEGGADRFFELYRAKYVAEKDIAAIAEWGYDLINEPVTPGCRDGAANCEGTPNEWPGEEQADALRALYVRLVEAIRMIDTNHILFIEGNYYATTFYKLDPPFDDNMVYAFHKYWNATDVGTINYLLELSTRNNVPLWLGESGENSNPWFFAVTRLAEAHGIGWNWWTHKKIATITSPLSAPFAPGYEEVIRYLNDTANNPRPSERAASEGLFAMAEGLDLDSYITRPGVLAALLDPDYATLRKPFKEHPIPGVINAVDYDIGHAGATYHDFDLMRVDGRDGAGNQGYEYRNDGVDIERSTDPEGFAYNVGWIETTEWLTWTVQIDTAGTYDVEIRVAADAADNGGAFSLWLDNERLGGNITVPVTGGWQTWDSVWLRDATLPTGEHILRLNVRNGGFNVNRMRFTLKEATAAEQADEIPEGMRLEGAYPNPFSGEVRLAFRTDRPVRARLEVVDVLGRTVYVHSPEAFGTGEHTLSMRPELPPGMYFSRLFLEDGERTHLLTAPVTAIP